jgi:hypothetical protein
LPQGSLPGQFLRVWLIMEDGRRGLGFSTTSLQPADSGTSADIQACLQTDVSYLLWEGKGDPARFCDCFARSNPTEAWNLLETYNGACNAGE